MFLKMCGINVSYILLLSDKSGKEKLQPIVML